MQVVCEATQASVVPIQVAAFECLVRIMSLYYEKMSFYMERALFGVSVEIRWSACHSYTKIPVDSNGNAPPRGIGCAAGDRVLEYCV
jgi:hypothetical protein